MTHLAAAASPALSSRLMGSVIVKIKHCVWRDGRPRFVPGPGLRKLGFRGRDLKHPDGRWLSLAEVEVFAGGIIAEAAARREDKKVKRPTTVYTVYTVAEMLADYWQSPKFNRLASKTRDWYRQMAGLLEAFDADILASELAHLTRPVLFGIYERLLEAKGPTTARGIIAALSAGLSYAVKRGRLPFNPALRLGMETPKPRIRIASFDEIRALIAAADKTGRPEIGDMIMLALFTGQRQGDRLAFEGGHFADGRLIFRQGKTGAIVAIPPAPALIARLEAAHARRAGATLQWPHVVIDETAQKPFKGDHYRHVFTAVRAAAVVEVSSVADFRDQDLRDTAVTWLANAGSTIPEICAVTGHSEASATRVLKHYLARTPEQADAAIDKLTAWMKAKGIRF